MKVTMFEGALAYIGLQIAKFQFRSDVDHVQPMTDFFHGAHAILLTLPVNYEDSVLAGNALRDFRKRRDDVHITILNNSTWSTSLADFQKSEVIRIDPQDINRFSLPTRKLLQRVLHREFDVAMDLNLDFVLHTAYICKASRAKVRVGFAHPLSDIFFNVQINLNKNRKPQAIYNRFAECLAMF